MAWDGLGLISEFHATTDAQVVRDRVFETLRGHDLRIDTTILEKSKARPQTRNTDERFYKSAWFLHLKHVAPRVVMASDQLLVVGASLGTKKKRQSLHEAITDVVKRVTPTVEYCVAAWTANSDPCLQVADYCCWAVQRKWERGDERSYELIADKIMSEFDVFRTGRRHYY